MTLIFLLMMRLSGKETLIYWQIIRITGWKNTLMIYQIMRMSGEKVLLNQKIMKKAGPKKALLFL